MTDKIIGVDEGGYYTDKEYVSDEIAKQQGFITPYTECLKPSKEELWN